MFVYMNAACCLYIMFMRKIRLTGQQKIRGEKKASSAGSFYKPFPPLHSNGEILYLGVG